MGPQALVSHAVWKKHITLTNRSQTFFQCKTIISNTKEPGSEHNPDVVKPSCKKKKVAEIAFNNTDRTKTNILGIELYYCRLFCVDSDIAKKFQLGPSKVEYLANFDIKPYLKNLLAESIKKLDCYCFLWWKFKEGNPKLRNGFAFTLLWLIWWESKNEILRFSFSWAATYSDAFDACKDLNPNHIYQILTDGPNINLKFYDCIVRKKKEKKMNNIYW